MKIAFTADTHLGQVQYGMQQRAADYQAVLSEVFESAVAEHCSCIVLGGDIFHTMRPPADAVQAVRNCISGLNGHVPVYSIDGNHDNTCGRWLRLCGTVPLGQWRNKLACRLGGNNDGCIVYGIDGGSANSILSELRAFADDPHANCAEILFLHLPLSEMSGFPVQVSCKAIADIVKDTAVKLVLLGDIHDGKEAVVDGIRFVYSGSPEITAIDENPEKSFVVVTVAKDAYGENTFDVRRVPLHPRKQEKIEISSEKDLDKLKLLLPEKDFGPLYHIAYDGGVANAKERIMSAAKQAGAMFRCFPSRPQEKTETKGYDRSGFRASLAEIVGEDFADSPEAAKLLLEILGLPAETFLEPVKKFLHKLGIRV